MMKKIIIPLVVLIVLVGGYMLLTADRSQMPQTETEQIMPAAEVKDMVVVYQNNAFNPAEIKIKVGESVTFVNKHIFAVRVSSNPHPIHTSYSKFESGNIEPKASYTFTTTEKATINYHDHFNPGAGGQIVVE